MTMSDKKDAAQVTADGVEEADTAHGAEKLLQFAFDDKVVEFRVTWTLEQVTDMIETVLKDDGYLWVPYDEEAGTGVFVNLKSCTNIRLMEVPKPKPTMEPQPLDPSVMQEYLDYLKSQYALPMFDGVIGRKSTEFLMAMLQERFGGMFPHEEMFSAIAEWRELYHDEG